MPDMVKKGNKRKKEKCNFRKMSLLYTLRTWHERYLEEDRVNFSVKDHGTLYLIHDRHGGEGHEVLEGVAHQLQGEEEGKRLVRLPEHRWIPGWGVHIVKK